MQASWYFVDLNCFWELTSSVCDMTIWNHPDTKRAQCLISHHDKNLNFFYTGSTELHVLNIFYTTPLNRFYYHGYCCSGERCGPLASCFNYSGSYVRQISGKSFKLVHHASQVSIQTGSPCISNQHISENPHAYSWRRRNGTLKEKSTCTLSMMIKIRFAM